MNTLTNLKSEINYFLYMIQDRLGTDERKKVEETIYLLLDAYFLSQGTVKYRDANNIINTIHSYICDIKKLADKDCLLIESDIPLLMSLIRYFHSEINMRIYN